MSNQERRKELLTALRNAGVPAEFHDENATLQPYVDRPGIPELRAILTHPDLRARMEQGVVLRVNETISRSNTRTTRIGASIVYRTVRALVLKGVGVKCMSYARFLDEVDHNRSAFMSDLQQYQVLALLGFDEAHSTAEHPFVHNPADRRMQHRLEWFFTSALQSNRSLLLHYGRDSENVSWWSDRLNSLLTERTICTVSLTA